MQIILDTSSLVSAVEWKVDLFDELRKLFPKPEFAVVEPTLHELQKLAKSNRIVGVVFQQLEKEKIRVIPGAGHADNLITAGAGKETAVLTQDAGLKKRVKAKGAVVVTIRQKKYLGVV